MESELTKWNDKDLCIAYRELKEFSNNGILKDGIGKEYAKSLNNWKDLDFCYSIAEINIEEEMAKRFFESKEPKEVNVDELWDRTLVLCDVLLNKMEHGNTEEALSAAYKARKISNIFKPFLKKEDLIYD